MRYVIAAAVVVVMAVAVIGIGMGDAPNAGQAAPTGKALAASKQAIADGGKAVQEGREEFEEEGCDNCHAIAATGAKGALGPRMDAQDDPVDEIAENIEHPHKDIAEGYDDIMPDDYEADMGEKEIKEVAAFVKAASSGSPTD